MKPLILKSKNLENDYSPSGQQHLLEMCDKIISGVVKEDKSHRWIGWIQGCVFIGGGASLKEMKKLNKLT